MSVYGDTVCHDPRKCFAKGDFGGCSLLLETYPEGVECKFCKPNRAVTAGKYYPIKREIAKPWVGMNTGQILKLNQLNRGKKNNGDESVHSNGDRTGNKFHRI